MSSGIAEKHNRVRTSVSRRMHGCREHRQKRAPRIHIPTGSDIERNPSRNLCHEKEDGNRTTPGNVSPHLKLVEVEIDSPFLKRPTPSPRDILASTFAGKTQTLLARCPIDDHLSIASSPAGDNLLNMREVMQEMSCLLDD
ncbi:hypothetical protein V1477_009289 [Vespula maculifrons]|uniref:Uncharacterized protein n=2 Tax=Vespula TaxID=7451 RepID=A0A834JYS3_VESVU|nr:hypothetical protein HZH66_007009 [Vespula vulgaris]